MIVLILTIDSDNWKWETKRQLFSLGREKIIERLQRQLDSGRINQQEYENIKNKMIDREKPPVLLRPPQLIIFIISLVWLGVGIRQWATLSKWDKKYQRFKKQQEDIDRKLDDNSDL